MFANALARVSAAVALASLSLLAFTTPATANGDNTYSLGLEGFYDHYREPDPDVDEKSGYGSITGHYNHDFSQVFLGLDGRVSYGRDDYSSPSGTEDNIPQWEYEFGVRSGVSMPLWHGTMSPYVGIGTRYFRDDNKGGFTNIGDYGYDRRILQFYIPVGTTYSYTTQSGWTLSPNVELDSLVYGQVNSRLTDEGGPNVYNNQRSGFGLRGEFMVGRAKQGYSWQAGPFVRYWDVRYSDPSADPQHPGYYFYEPQNMRLQTGLAVRVLW